MPPQSLVCAHLQLTRTASAEGALDAYGRAKGAPGQLARAATAVAAIAVGAIAVAVS